MPGDRCLVFANHVQKGVRLNEDLVDLGAEIRIRVTLMSTESASTVGLFLDCCRVVGASPAEREGTTPRGLVHFSHSLPSLQENP